MGVLIDFSSNFQIGQEFSFKLMDSSGIAEVSYYINEKKLLCPAFSQNYQVIIIHNIQFIAEENGSLVGLLNGKSRYKVLSNTDITKYPNYMMLISKVRDAHKPNSAISSENFESQPEAKKIKYTDYIESTQYATTSVSQSHPMLENSLVVSSRNALNEVSSSFRSSSSGSLLNSLSDIRSGKIYQIIAQVVKLERTYNNRNEYIITDYSCGNNLKSGSVELPNSKFLYGNYFLNLTVWDDQKESIEVSKFYHFSLVRTKLDKLGNIELIINGARPNVKSNVTIPLTINQMECRLVKERMDIALGSDIDKSTQPASLREVIRESKFCLVQNLQTKGYYDMALLILKKFDTGISGKLILLCTDFTPNPMLKYHPYSDDKGIVLDSNMCIHLTCWDDTANLMEDIVDNNPNRNILQFRGIRAETNHRYGIELHLRSSAVTYDQNMQKMLEFDPIPAKDSFYYKEIVKRRQDHFNQFNPQTQDMGSFNQMLIDDEEYEHLSNPDLDKAENQNSNDKIIVNDLSQIYSNESKSAESVQRDQNPKDVISRDSAAVAIDSRAEIILIDNTQTQSKDEELQKHSVKLVHIEPRTTDKMLRFVCTSGCWKSQSFLDQTNSESDIGTQVCDNQNAICKRCSKEMELTLTMLYTCQLMNVKPKQTINFIASHELSKKILNVEFNRQQASQKQFHDGIRRKLCELALKPFVVYSLPTPFFQQENTKVYRIKMLVRHE
ncbi:hypothetical protein CONCODRAFT_16076 [Conidiobolus coronatus NRRL 28638]|uniref:Protection of telomeres protein 1 ssDNA-binding domain-containing protein n=1 Tax=Conidiobolus coronatus (strain ATCC 28846 / CBS 209.66 / NRRL 28638) TaxID=796925 RepID=A0A137PC18_CONC2|nr:hypothetical protein CONCODRAFT_16076 [Conidiobolus coronatus NRRL 28638]|eukprot:KXN72536.1 hypothetical protein CONCODRAFT_16076 [Conidiobolus coronatus NRRL 28638]